MVDVLMKSAIEVDRDMLRLLESMFLHEIEEKRLVLVHGSVLDVEMPPFTKCVANIPYYVGSPRNRFRIDIFGFASALHSIETT